MSTLVYLELAGGDDAPIGGAPTEPSLQALTLARALDGGSLHAVAASNSLLQGLPAAVGSYGVGALHTAQDEVFATHAPVALARTVLAAAEACGATHVVGPGTESGNEVLAHIAALLDVPFAANCVSVAQAGDALDVTRLRWGGSLLEEARLIGTPAVLSVQPHAVAAESVGGGIAAVEPLTVNLAEADRVVRVVERIEAAAGGVSLADAKVVVTGGRGVGSPEGFAVIVELAGLLGAAVGCSRAVTIAGWRPHTDQVGQTGTKVAPDLYIACGVSGATQHMAGCKGAKRILAINTDREAPIVTNADYAVIGDLHDVLPAISAELGARL
jgi:electron transfer flavoprotein alpha subunit